jgi:hypothetical protein
MSYDTSFITNPHDKIMIDTSIRAINNLELWNWLKNNDFESFMFSKDQNITKIYNEIEKVGYNGHSGASFGFTMRIMEFIAKNSFDSYRINYEVNRLLHEAY